MKAEIFGQNAFQCWSEIYISPILHRFCSVIVDIAVHVAVIDLMIYLKLVAWPYMKLCKYNGNVSLVGFPVQYFFGMIWCFQSFQMKLKWSIIVGDGLTNIIIIQEKNDKNKTKLLLLLLWQKLNNKQDKIQEKWGKPNNTKEK